jgi:hypothetical protein
MDCAAFAFVREVIDSLVASFAMNANPFGPTPACMKNLPRDWRPTRHAVPIACIACGKTSAIGQTFKKFAC